MYGSYSYGKRHLGRPIPTYSSCVTIGNAPPRDDIFSGPPTKSQFLKWLEVDELVRKKRKLKKKTAEKSQNDAKKNLPEIVENKENRSPNVSKSIEKLDGSNNSSNNSNATYTLEGSDSQSPSHVLNSTYDKIEETENFNLQIDVTQNATLAQQKKSFANKFTHREYRNRIQDSMMSETYLNINKTVDVSQMTEASVNMNYTNRSILRSFDNLKLDDECGNLTNMSMRAYKDSPIAKVLMDDKFSQAYNPSTNESKKSIKGKSQHKLIPSSTPTRKSLGKEQTQSKCVTPNSAPVRKSVLAQKEKSSNRSTQNISVRKSLNKEQTLYKCDTPNSTPIRKSASFSLGVSPRTSTLPRKSANRSQLRNEHISNPSSARKSLSFALSLEELRNTSSTSVSTSSNKKFENKPVARKSSSVCKSITKEGARNERPSTVTPTVPKNSTPKRSVPRKSLRMSKDNTQNINPSDTVSSLTNEFIAAIKENVSKRATPGKMSATLITDLKAEHCLINTSLRDSINSNNRSTPDIFQKTSNEMWKPKPETILEKSSLTPFKSKLPQLKKTPGKYDAIKSPVSKYIHRGEAVKSMSKLRHSGCIHPVDPKSQSETKNKPCKIPLRRNAQRKLDLPKGKFFSNPCVSSKTPLSQRNSQI